MLKIGDKITIKRSRLLTERGLDVLANKTGIVTKVLVSQGRLLGCYVDVKIMRKSRNYFIPFTSIGGAETVNRTRTLSIMKSTIL